MTEDIRITITILMSVTLLVIIVFFDLQKRKIPNKIVIIFTSIALFLNFIFDNMMSSVIGATLGFAFLLVPFLLNGLGAGDVKGFAALGALIGPLAIFQTFLYTALIGGGISLVYIVIAYDIREKARAGMMALGAFAASRDPSCLAPGPSKKKHKKFPYAPAMGLGYLAFLAWGNLV
jgi:prepilin peptidase CpaA